MGAWCGSWVWFHRAPGPLTKTAQLYLASALWAAWSLFIWAANAYSPGRYVVHLIVPATIHLMVGFSLGDRLTLSRIDERFKRSSGLARIAWLTWLVLPASIVGASQMVALAGLSGLDIADVSRHRTALIGAAALAFGLLVHRTGAARRAIAMCLLAPVIAILIWCLGWEFELFRHFWEYQSPQANGRWLLAGGLALATAALLAPLIAAGRNTVAIQAGILLAVAVPLIYRATIPLRDPTFTIRDASVDIGRLITPSAAGEVRVRRASSLFLENTLRYRELSSSDMGFDWLLIFEHERNAGLPLRSVSEPEIERVRTYTLAFDSRYEYDSTVHQRPQFALLHRRPTQPALAPGSAAR